MEHIYTKYVKIDDKLILKNRKDLKEAPDFLLPLNVYFNKQEYCQKLAANGKVSINEEDMVLQLQTHVGSTDMINTKYATWKKKSLTYRGWKYRKNKFCAALKDVYEITKLTTNGSGLTANSAIKKEKIKDKTRVVIVEKFGESFDTLALAETVKSDTINALVELTSNLTKDNINLNKANDNLAATNNELTTQIESMKCLRNQPNNHPSNNTRTTENNKEWPRWCDSNAYCFTCRYNLRKS